MGAILVRRNILVFVLDQLSARALDIYGGQFHMDNISALAADGVTVSDCYTTYPLCQPARASLWTGMYSHRNRVWSNGRQCPITPIDESFPALGDSFSAAGYETRHFGKKHDGGALRGFVSSEEKEKKIPDENPAFPFNMDTYADAYTMDEVLSYLDGRDDERPLLMVVDLINPHNICGWIGVNKGKHEDVPIDGELPELPPNFYFDDILSRPLPVQYLCCSHVRQGQTSEWNEDNFRHYLAAYRYYLSIADRQIGQVLDAYRKAGLMDDSLIVFTSDHGDNITARRSVTKQVTLYEEVTRVPLILSGPAVKAKGRKAEGLASLLDLFPTLLSAASIEQDPRLDGVDISAVLDGGELPERKYITSEWYTEWGYTISPGRMIRSGNIKYMRYLEGDGEELYDLEADPYEKRNLAGDESYNDTLERMRDLLSEYIRESDDPFFSLSVKADKRWRSHKPGYENHRGPTAPEV